MAGVLQEIIMDKETREDRNYFDTMHNSGIETDDIGQEIKELTPISGDCAFENNVSDSDIALMGGWIESARDQEFGMCTNMAMGSNFSGFYFGTDYPKEVKEEIWFLNELCYYYPKEDV